MKEIKVGDKSVRVRATPLALFYYRQEFGTDLIGDIISIKNPKLSSTICLQVIWAMAKAESFGKPFPSFEVWIAGLTGIDFSDPSFSLAALEVATNGFFRGGQAPKEG
jgi:hypothetical protein